VRPKGQKSKKKRKYRIRNWHDYKIVSITQHWSKGEVSPSGLRETYCKTGEVYRLPLRATEGLLRSLVALLGAEVPIPCYSTLSRRQPGLPVALEAPTSAEPLHLVVDGTGLKVFGEGEWKVRQHGTSKRRTWRKVHLAVDQKTGYVQAAATTNNNITDVTQTF